MNKIIASWTDIEMRDVFFAYRKSKADCFFETSIRVAEKFILYEEKLGTRLSRLLKKIQDGDIGEILIEGMGSPELFPKKLSFTQKGHPTHAHVFFSDAKRAFKNEIKNAPRPEFRFIGNFSVDLHILSALWVNLVGHKFDAQLGHSALASRLRRYSRDRQGRATGDYHLEAIGSFEPYFEPYRRWRDSGLDAIRRSLESNQDIVALTLDVSNFYHSIDSTFITDPAFHEYTGVHLTNFELEFTKCMVDALNHWSARCAEKVAELGCADQPSGGLPIGLSVVRVLANVIMLYLDKEVERSLYPIYYARYVDDIFLVIKDNESFETPTKVWDAIQRRIPAIHTDKNSNRIELKLPPWGHATRLFFQPEKQKCFFLSGSAGLDLLQNIAAQIREVSSERRLMPLPEQLDQTQSARALTADQASDEADTLRRADGLTLRRLGWSVLLRSVEVLSRDLQPEDWKKERERFYDFAHDHVIRADKILEQIDKIPRLLSIAVSLSDWREALKIYNQTISSIYALQDATIHSKMRINGYDCDSTPVSVWDETRAQVRRFFREALLRSFAVEKGVPISRSCSRLLNELGLTSPKLLLLARAAREADWSRLPYKEHLRLHARRHAPAHSSESVLYGQYANEDTLRRFLTKSVVRSEYQACIRVHPDVADKSHDSLLPYLFPTRAYSPEEIALYLPAECVYGEPYLAAQTWADYTRAVRGVWVRIEMADEGFTPSDYPEIELNNELAEPVSPESPIKTCQPSGSGSEFVLEDRSRIFPVRIGITSFSTSDETWALGAAGNPDLSPKRYKAIAEIINDALKESKRPDYLVLPELSLPERWIKTVSSRLQEGNINLIAGLDYQRHAQNQIDSSAVLVLEDNRLGYSNSLQIRQRKSQPAPGEEKSLLSSHGQSWKDVSADEKPIYNHNDFYFSVLICSELQNITYRQRLQGKVDCIFVLSWNKDLETFSALVDSASLDVHAYIALSNNLRYGDSRVRSPAKESFHRDLCRVRGGVNNQLVVVELDPRALRAQQSRAKRWPEDSDPYKPAPEGFKISDGRSTTPS